MTASQCLSLLATISSCNPMIPWAHWHLRQFQLGFLVQENLAQLETVLLSRRKSAMAAEERNLEDITPLRTIILDHCYNRHQQDRLGDALRGTVISRQVEIPSQGDGLECARSLGNLFATLGPASQDQGQTSPSAVRQQGSNCLYSTPRRNL